MLPFVPGPSPPRNASQALPTSDAAHFGSIISHAKKDGPLIITPCLPEKRSRFVFVSLTAHPRRRTHGKKRASGPARRKSGHADADGARPFPVRAAGQRAADKKKREGWPRRREPKPRRGGGGRPTRLPSAGTLQRGHAAGTRQAAVLVPVLPLNANAS
jgi:hypothetical protein